MNSYKDMYYKLFNTMTDILVEIERIQQETEEMFLAQDESPNIVTINQCGKKV